MGRQAEINKFNLDNQITFKGKKKNEAAAVKMDELIAAGRTTPPAHLSLPANISLMLQPCLVLIGMRGHALLPAFLPSAITSQFFKLAEWSGPYLSTQMVTLLL